MKMTTKDLRMRQNCKIYVAGTQVPLTQEDYGGWGWEGVIRALVTRTIFVLSDFGVQIEK